MNERIVVGVDGSEGSMHALRWAIEDAWRRSATVEIVHAWQYPLSPNEGFGSYELLATAAEEAALRVLQNAREYAQALGGSVTVTARVVQRSAPGALVEASEGAALLVIGSRGLGAFRSLLLGSVSLACVKEAKCPVVVVPDAFHEVEGPSGPVLAGATSAKE